jgi:NAD(P)H-dependent flavin oxidoreductase YrpB (nitropropane dioxygenase family)
MLHTRVTRLFGIEHPIVLGGMSSATNVDLVVAVSEAGGLGILGATSLTPDQILRQAAEIRARTTRPFGMNLLIPFTSTDQLEAVLEADVSVLSSAWGTPTEHAKRARDAGVPLLHMVQTAAQAAEAARLGAAAIVAQGTEGGGHVGTVATLTLVPAAVDAVRAAMSAGQAAPPIIAAGGIADGRGLVAALALGADGVLLGTRFLATSEAPVPAAAQRAICDATEADTVLTTVNDLMSNPRWTEAGALSRGLRTRALEEWLGRETEIRGMDADGRQKVASEWARARAEGRVEDMVILAGQDSGLIHEVLPVAEVVRRIVAEAEEVLGQLRGQ